MVDVAGARDGSPHALGHGGKNFQVMLVMVAPHADAVTRDDLLCWLGGVAVEFDVPGAHCGGSLGTGLEHANRPDPGIDTNWAAVWLNSHRAA